MSRSMIGPAVVVVSRRPCPLLVTVAAALFLLLSSYHDSNEGGIVVHAFTILPNRLAAASTTTTRVSAAKPLATFDASDFALPSGEWPYSTADLNRLDNSLDTNFYDTPRFVTHIDDRAIASLTEFYREELVDAFAATVGVDGGNNKSNRPLDILDLCSSWISHLPSGVESEMYGRVVGIGMNERELAANPQLTEYRVQDLNSKPSLEEFPDDSFDVVCNVVSVDYLTQPLPIFQETYRVLRPGGRALISFSNRCFPTKAVAMWLQADDIGRLTIVASYFHYASDRWESIEALDIKLPPTQNAPERPSVGDILKEPSKALAWVSSMAAVTASYGGDPMFVVKGIKKS